MYVSKEVDYGLRIMIALGSTGTLLSEGAISKKHHIPHNFLSLILPKLIRAGLVVAVHEDKKTGYRLNRYPADIHLLDILEVVNGPLDLIALNRTNRHETSEFHAMMTMWAGLKTVVEDYLSGRTLESCLMSSNSERT